MLLSSVLTAAENNVKTNTPLLFFSECPVKLKQPCVVRFHLDAYNTALSCQAVT